MSGIGFIRMLRFGFGLGLFFAAMIFGLCAVLYQQAATEIRFRHQYGASWQVQYEANYGSITQAHIKLAAGAIGLIVIAVLLVWISKLLQSNHRSRAKSNHTRRHHGSNLERIMVYRRKALVRNYFGVIAVLLGGFLQVFHLGIFSDHSNQQVLGLFIFLVGYAGVISGCTYWLKAKQLNEAIVFIGLMPLAVLLVPFVRLILFATPALLFAGMLMMSLVLIVVVLTLPNRSGEARRKSSSNLLHNLVAANSKEAGK